jgi:hypothetical protein
VNLHTGPKDGPVVNLPTADPPAGAPAGLTRVRTRSAADAPTVKRVRDGISQAIRPIHGVLPGRTVT